MSLLKNRALKLEKQTAWLWYEEALTDEFSASILFMLIKQDILKAPPSHIWKRIEQGHHECELKRVNVQNEWDRREGAQEIDLTPERGEEIEAEMHVFVTALCFALWSEAPRECRAVDGERVLLEMLQGWIGEVRADAREWPLSTLKLALQSLASNQFDDGPTFKAECVRFVQRWKA